MPKNYIRTNLHESSQEEHRPLDPTQPDYWEKKEKKKKKKVAAAPGSSQTYSEPEQDAPSADAESYDELYRNITEYLIANSTGFPQYLEELVSFSENTGATDTETQSRALRFIRMCYQNPRILCTAADAVSALVTYCRCYPEEAKEKVYEWGPSLGL